MKKRYDMKKIMSTAWKIAREKAVKLGGKAVQYLGYCLKMVWAKYRTENILISNMVDIRTIKRVKALYNCIDKTIQFEYTNTKGEKKTRLVSPQFIFYSKTKDKVYLKAVDLLDEKRTVKMFFVDGIKYFDIVQEKIEKIQGIDLVHKIRNIVMKNYNNSKIIDFVCSLQKNDYKYKNKRISNIDILNNELSLSFNDNTKNVISLN